MHVKSDIFMKPEFGRKTRNFLNLGASMPSLEKLIYDKNAIIPIVMMNWFVKGQRIITITGRQGSGKTVFLKALIRLIPPEYTLRVSDAGHELTLKELYPQRNVTTVSLNETHNMDIKDKQVCIIGELGKSSETYYAIRPDAINCLYSLFTHHANTTHNLVTALANNLLASGKYDDSRNAISIVSNALNIDCHMEISTHGDRHISRITEIIPLYSENNIAQSSTKQARFTTQNIVRRYPIIKDGHEEIDENGNTMGIFKFENLPSKKMMEEIKSKLQLDEIAEFENDMRMLKLVSEKGDDDEEVRDWVQVKLLALKTAQDLCVAERTSI